MPAPTLSFCQTGKTMKFRVTFKTPDALDYALDDFPYDESREEAKEVAKQFIEYGEYITVEFDTEAKTATVVPLRKR